MCCPTGTISSFSPHTASCRGAEVPGGPPVRPEYRELGLPRLLAGLPDHPGFRRVQQRLAPLLEFVGAQGLALLVHPPPEREVLRDADLGLRVVRHGVHASDAVLRPPSDQGLVALQPHQGFRPVDPCAQERGDRGGVPQVGEVQQSRLGGGVGVVLLVLAVALAASPDDPPVLVAPNVDLALAVGEGAGGLALEDVAGLVQELVAGQAAMVGCLL